MNAADIILLIILAMAIIINIPKGCTDEVIINIWPATSKQPTQLVLTTIINKTKIQIMGVSLNKAEFVDTILSLKDIVTGAAVADVVFSDIALTSSDETIFTANTDVNNDGQVDVVGVAPGTAQLGVKATATYTNSNGESISETKEATVEVTVSAPPADSTELSVNFTAPAKV